jgi:LysM repeat protein
MSFWGRLSFCLLLLAALISVNGCLPSDSGSLDEEKEPHFVLGKSRVNAMDYDGAIEAFEESLEVNPHSAAAHFQLACLFDTKKSDPAAAIYHYREYLRLNPKADNAEVIRQRIYSCKQQLAADVMPLPSTPAAQRQLEDLAEKNRQLQAQVDQLNTAVRQWSDYYAAQQAALKTNPPESQNNFTFPTATGSPLPDDESVQSAAALAAKVSTPVKPKPSAAARPRTHTVAAGETLASIARKYGVSLTAIQAANPGVTPKKLRVGQTVKLPPP